MQERERDYRCREINMIIRYDNDRHQVNMIMPQLRKYILRGCGIFVFVILMSAKDGNCVV